MTVAGTVISSADNQPIVGANIYVEGTNVGTTTDAGGNYKLTVPASAKTVTVSFLGYDTKKISVRDIHLFKLITLADASNKLEDVVVVGFGVQKKESLVGAVQSVKPSDLQTSSSNLSTSFSGKIAGVIAVQKSGEPGADGANFWIRGISTFGSGQSPLLILDGVEITNQMLNNIPPETIESFSVLKDATATALYGSRGATFTAHLPQMPRPPHSAPSSMPALSRQSFRLVPASDWKRYRLPPANTSMFMMLMSAHPCCPNPFRKAKTEPGIACSKPLSISLRSRLPPWE